MEGETPRTLIRGVLQTGHSTRSSQRRTKQTPSRMDSQRPPGTSSVSRLRQQPISSSKVSSSVSSSVKRPARGSLTSEAKRRRSVTATPSESITPRANIRAYLATADTKTPAQPSSTRTSRQRLSQSAISNRQVVQVAKLVASGTASRRSSLGRKSLSQSFPTPSENITPREALKLYLKAADTVPRARRSTPRRSNLRNVEDNQGESSEEKQDDSESAAADDELSQDEQTKAESSAESGEYRVENVQAESGDEHVESGDERVESGDERVESGDERVESGDERVESGGERVESEDERVESGDERVESGDERVESGDERAESGDEKSEIGDESEDDDQSRIEGGEHETMSGHSRSGVEWRKLRTPVLPDETIVKATPIVLGKPPRSTQQKKPSKLRKASGKENQGKQPKKKTNPVLRLPSSLVNGIFRHFSALRVSKDALDAVQVGSEAFFKHVATDLTSFCEHARRTIEESDVELLMRRQSLVTSKESFHSLIEKYLPMEYRREIIPTAKSGNKVVPKAKT